MMMPLEIGWSATVMWHAGDFFCRCFSFFRIFGMFLSSNVLVCISLDRYANKYLVKILGNSNDINKHLNSISMQCNNKPKFYFYRFYAIVCPLSSGKAVRNMKSLLASAWIFSILCASPQVRNNQSYCFQGCAVRSQNYYFFKF
jgi:hypothetical protein